jgi:hypothetical protein
MSAPASRVRSFRKRTRGRRVADRVLVGIEIAAKTVRRGAHSDQLGVGHRIEGITSTAMCYCRVLLPPSCGCLKLGAPSSRWHLAFVLPSPWPARRRSDTAQRCPAGCPQAVEAGAAMAHRAVPEPPTPIPETLPQRETQAAGNCACTQNTPIAPRPGLCAEILVFSLLFYGTQPHIIVGPPHRKNCCLPRKTRAPLKRVSDRVQTYISAHQFPSCRLRLLSRAPASICGPEVKRDSY